MRHRLAQALVAAIPLVACGGGSAHGCGPGNPFPSPTSQHVAVGDTAQVRAGAGNFAYFIDFDGALWWPATNRTSDFLARGELVEVTLQKKHVDGEYGDGALTVRRSDGSTTQYSAGPGCA